MDRSLSALLAVRNVQCTLRTTVLEMLDLMSELTCRFEVVLVDDCSTDATIEVADELTSVYPQLFVLRHETPRGYWSSIRAALERSLGEWILFAEEDRVVAWDQMARLWMLVGQCDLVVGRPTGCDRGKRATPANVLPSGGFLMGRRPICLAASDALGDWPAFSAKLETLGARCREVSLAVPAWHRWQLPTSALAAATDSAEPGVRSVRPHSPEVAPSKPVFLETTGKKSPSLSERHLHPATELLE